MTCDGHEAVNRNMMEIREAKLKESTTLGSRLLDGC
jgi:hypothetical protein